MVPGVPLAVIGRVGGVAVLLLLGDEGPLLIELDLTREGGKSDQLVVKVAGVRAAIRLGGRPCRDTLPWGGDLTSLILTSLE